MRDFRARRAGVRTMDELRTLARETLTKLDALGSGADAGPALFHAGEMCLVLDDVAAALPRLRQAVEKGLAAERLTTARYLLGELSLQEHDYEASRRWFGEFAKEHASDPRAAEARLMIETSRAIEGKPDAAIEGIRKILGEMSLGHPEHVAASLAAAVQHFAERTADAKASLEFARKCPDLTIAEGAKRRLATLEWIGRQPPLAAKDAAGGEVDLAKLKGRVVLLYFYSITSPSAPMEASAVRRILKACEGRPVSAIGVCLDPAKEDFDLFRTDQAISWPLVHDAGGTDGPLAKSFGVTGTPHVLLLDRKGAVRFFNPMLTSSGMDMRVLAERLAAEK
jgi:peroxiredoxin